MQACWEEGDAASIHALLDNFSRLLRRRKMLSYHKSNYLNFARLLKGMAGLAPRNAKGKANLLAEVGSAEPLIYKAWFLEKLEQGTL